MNAQSPESFDIGLRLLDRQIVDCNERPLSNVDDIRIAFDADGRPYIDALLCGPGAWAPRLRGRIGRWALAIWTRLHPAVHPQPAVIPMSAVTKLDSAVHLSVPRKTTTAVAIDTWVDRHIISKIPGAGDAE